MRRVIIDGVNNFSIKEVEIPKISSDEVLVKMEAASLCNQTDLHIIEGTHPSAQPFPSVFGHEGAGTIVEVGSSIKNFKVGDRVAVRGQLSGCYSEYSCAITNDLSRIPDGVSFEIASITEIAGGSFCIVDQTVRLADSVIIIGQGASGLVGTQLAKAAGAGLIVVSEISSFKRSLAKEFGADIVINPLETDVIEFAKEITSGSYFDVVLEYGWFVSCLILCLLYHYLF
jgi:L-iditol 2-dehydrogenase